MKKIRNIIFIVLISLLAFGCYLVFGNSTKFTEKEKYFTISEADLNKARILEILSEKEIISNRYFFQIIASQMNIWGKIKAGKYKVQKGTNVLSLVRMLRNNQQAEVKLIINKIRVKEDLAKLIGKNFSTDSSNAIIQINSLIKDKKFELTDENFLFNITPNTYNFSWNTSVEKILETLVKATDNFWNSDERSEKAKALNFSNYEINTIASIVEEETNKDFEKGNIASVYMNRLKKGMNLGADPTVKYALKNFGLKRILYEHLKVESPYNTYKNKGLPPGAICTPSSKTIDAVLAVPTTDYLFFVASNELNGTHHFSNNFAEHNQYAKLYHTAVTKFLAEKKVP